ncbi:MAG: low temperature requirement protein A [Myxococcota bacterium]
MSESPATGFRRWWRPPRRASDRDPDRKVTFLELFYDLVYVVLVSQVAHYLSENVDAVGIARSLFLFLLLWLAWVNGTLYHELHGNNDVRTRVFTFLQMTAVAGMAVFAHDAFGEGAAGFALSVASFQGILTYLWFRTGSYDPPHRPLSYPYAGSYLVSTLLFAGSAFVEDEVRPALWGAGLLASVAVQLYQAVWPPRDPEIRAERQRSLVATPSLVERFGLLTIIVLGEVIVGVVSGVSQTHHVHLEVGAAAVGGLLLSFGIWWLYFDLVAHHLPHAGEGNRAWTYLHLPVTAGIAATGAAVLDLVEHTEVALPSEERWLVVGAVALTEVSVAALMWTLQLWSQHRRIGVRITGLLVASAGGTLALGLTELDTVELLFAIDGLVLPAVVYSLAAWIREFGGEEVTID